MRHLRDGTYQASRHPPLPGNVLPMLAPHRPAEPDLGALQEPGRAFVARMVGSYTFTLSEGVVLLEAAHITDRLAALWALSEPAVRDEVALSRLLASLIA